MKEPVVITKPEFQKGKSVFNEYSDTINWIPCEEVEEKVSETVEKSGARIVVLGVKKYENSIYSALSLNAGKRPALIARHGVGFDGINVERCRKYNIFVSITPDVLDQSVAEHAIALLLSLARGIPELDVRMRHGNFSRRIGFELHGKRLGIAGFGNIGRKVALIAARGFGMEVNIFDSRSLEELALPEKLDMKSYCSQYGIKEYFSDFKGFARSINLLTIHMPVNEHTHYFFNSERLGCLSHGSILINTSRGELIDEKALFETLASGRIKAAGLDVFNCEPYKPVSPDHDLRKLPNVILTPHTASDTVEANIRVERKVVENIRYFLEKKYQSLTLAL